jgi:hypothetical protein
MAVYDSGTHRESRLLPCAAMRKPALGLVMIVLCLSVTGTARQDWLPPPVAEALAEQLVRQLEAIGPGKPTNRAALLAGVRQRVQALRTTIEGWGVRGVLERTPTFTGVELPASGERHLDAMAGFQLCNVVLGKQIVEGEDTDTRRTGAMGTMAVTTVVLFLRQPFVAEGGTHARIEAHLTGDPMSRVTTTIQQSQSLLQHVQSACSPIVAELFDAFS